MSSTEPASEVAFLGSTMALGYFAFILLAFSTLLYTVSQIFFTGKKPASIPWGPSGGHGVVAALDSAIKSAINIQQTLTLSQVLLIARSSGIMISTVLDGAMVVLPMRNLKWLSSLPEKTLSFHAAHEERLQLSYTIPAATLTDPDLVKLLVKILTRRTKGVVPEIHDEIGAICEDAAYGSLEWKPLCLSTEVLRLLTATSNRMLVGLPLCRDAEFLRLLSSYSRTALPSALLIRIFPRVLRPIVGRLVRALRIWRYDRKLLRTLVPLTTELLQERDAAGNTSRSDETFASWWVKDAANVTNNPKALDPAVLATVIIQLNFAGTHGTSLATTNVLYHILSCKDAQDLIIDLRNEIEGATRSEKGHWTWACVEKMELLDSVVRESLRCAPIDSAVMGRILMTDVETPDGLHLSAGTKVCLPGLLANLDETYYENAAVFNPYRFVERKEKGVPETSSVISEHFTSFGYGIHSCPGRWFATAEMKLIIAHLLTHYDFQPIPAMPKGFDVGTMMIPSTTYEVNVRARQGGGGGRS